MNQDVIFGINGPVVTVQNSRSFSMMEQVYVGNSRLVGEVIKISDQITTIQVYEETTGLRPGEPVYGTGAPMNILLGPGILDNIFDGIERPLKALEAADGSVVDAIISIEENIDAKGKGKFTDSTAAVIDKLKKIIRKGMFPRYL